MRFSLLPASVPQSKLNWIFLLTIRFLVTSLLTSNLTLRTADAHDLPADWSEFRSGCFSSASCSFNGPSTRVHYSSQESRKAFHNSGKLASAQTWLQRTWEFHKTGAQDVVELGVVAYQRSQQLWSDVQCQSVRIGAQVRENIALYRSESKASSLRVLAEIDTEQCEWFLSQPTTVQWVTALFGARFDEVASLGASWINRGCEMIEQSTHVIATVRSLATKRLLAGSQPSLESESDFKFPMFVTFETKDGSRFLLTREQAKNWGIAHSLPSQTESSQTIHAAVNSWGAPCMAR